MAEAPVQTRLATADDAPALARLAGQLGYPTPDSVARDRLADLPDADEIRVAVADGEVVGWIHLTIHRMLLADPTAVILGLVVDEAWRSRGVGKALLACAETYAMNRGVAAISVRSNAIRERAHAFYRREGFVQTKLSVALSRRVNAAAAAPEASLTARSSDSSDSSGSSRPSGSSDRTPAR